MVLRCGCGYDTPFIFSLDVNSYMVSNQRHSVEFYATSKESREQTLTPTEEGKLSLLTTSIV